MTPEERARDVVISWIKIMKSDPNRDVLQENIATAIREAIAAEREACAKAVWDAGGDNVEFHVAAIRSRSNEGGEG